MRIADRADIVFTARQFADRFGTDDEVASAFLEAAFDAAAGELVVFEQHVAADGTELCRALTRSGSICLNHAQLEGLCHLHQSRQRRRADA